MVVSLKHCLEAAKSPLQGALMEFVVGLTQTHKVEVDTALRFDPMLKVHSTSATIHPLFNFQQYLHTIIHLKLS